MKTLVAFVLPFVTNCLQIENKDYGVWKGSKQIIKCKYDSWYADYVKYWCRGFSGNFCSVLCSTEHCSNSNVELNDNRNDNEIIITMDRLDKEDSGWYWCGIEKTSWPDLMDYTHITVSESDEANKGNKIEGENKGNKVQPVYYILIPLLCLAIPFFIAVLFVGRFLIKKNSAGNNLMQLNQDENPPVIVITPPSANSETSIMYAEVVLNSKEKATDSKIVSFGGTSQGEVTGTCGPVYSEVVLQ